MSHPAPHDETTLSEQPGIADDGFSTNGDNEKREDLERGASTPILVEWQVDDPENPFNWSRTKKWVITFTACSLTIVSASTGGIIEAGYPSMRKDLHASQEEAALTLSMYALGFGLAPLFLASFSEEWGRRPMYIVFSGLFTIFFIPIAAAQNIQTVIISRFLQGAAGSTGATMVGGTIADIWNTHERGLPMSMFALAAIFGTGAGPVVAGWVEQTIRWRWIEWIAMCLSGALTIWLVVYGAQETRGTIILTRRAKRLRKETGNPNYRTPFNAPNIRELIWISVTRPMYLLCTEPVVICFSTWLGFVWGCLYGLLQSLGLVFQSLYGFNSGQLGLVFLTICLGSVIGMFVNHFQEKMYQKNVARIGAEARLYAAMGAGITFVIGSLIYAWTSYSFVHWIAPCIGVTIIIASIFTIYLSVFNYLADSYLIYASSALAGQSLVRNLSATAFPLFTEQMYNSLGFNWASTLLGLIAALLAPIPIVLFFYGPAIRARSRFAKKLAAAELK